MQFEEKYRDYNNGGTLKIINIPEEIRFNPNIEQSLKNIISKEGYVSYEISRKNISTGSGNYVAELYEVNVTGRTKDNVKETNIFVKHISHNSGVECLIDVEVSFMNEVFIYTDLWNVYDYLQETAKIPDEERFKMVKGYAECDVDAIMLENLIKKGFTTLNRMGVVPLKFAEKSIIQLAKFHGLSFALENEKREYFDEKIKTLECTVYFNEQWKQFVERIYQYSLVHFDGDIREKIEKFRDTLYHKYPKYRREGSTSVRCLCHGDFKMNNVLVKGNDEDAEAVIIDYQLINYGPPVLDLIYFMAFETDRKFRKEHWSHLLNLYHKTLTDYLKYFNLDVNQIYPKEAFERDFEVSLDYGLITALYGVVLIFTEEEGKISNFLNDNSQEMTVKINEKFKDRITEIVEDYISWGIL